MGDGWPIHLTAFPGIWELPSGPASAVLEGILEIDGLARRGKDCVTQIRGCQDCQALPRLQCRILSYIYRGNFKSKRTSHDQPNLGSNP